ncbi:MAG: PKD domain-containing protein [Candidatus Margulisiibacteriota bacterium]
MSDIGTTIMNFFYDRGPTGSSHTVGFSGCTAEGLDDSCVASNYSPAAGDPYVDPASQNNDGTVTFGDPVTFVLPFAERCNGDTSGIEVTFTLGPVINAPMTLNPDGSYSITIDAFNWGGDAEIVITDIEHESFITKHIYGLPTVVPSSDTEPYDVCDEYPSPVIFATGITSSPHVSDVYAGENIQFSVPLALVSECDPEITADSDGNNLEAFFITDNAYLNATIDLDSGVFYTDQSFANPGNQIVRFEVWDTSRPQGDPARIDTGTFYVQDPSGVIDKPPAAIVAPFAGYVGDNISFISPSADEATYSYGWNFVDGSPAESGSAVLHAFSNPGTYDIRLTVASLSDPSIYNLVTQSITIVPVGVEIPALSMALPDAAEEDTSVAMSVVAPDLANWDYSWKFANGDPIAYGTNVSATYAEPGTYTVILYATSLADPSVVFTISQTLKIVGHGNPVPNLVLSPASMGPVPLTVNFDATGSYATAGNLNPEDIVNYTINYGDDNPPVTNGTGIFSHQYNDIGAFTVTLTVEDQNSQTSTITTTVNTWGS